MRNHTTKVVLAFASLLLAGCQGVPPGLESTVSDVEKVDGTIIPLRGSPSEAAACIDKTIQTEVGALFVARNDQDGVARRLQVRGPYGTTALITITPSGPDSTALIKVSNHYVGQKSHTIKQMVNNC